MEMRDLQELTIKVLRSSLSLSILLYKEQQLQMASTFIPRAPYRLSCVIAPLPRTNFGNITHSLLPGRLLNDPASPYLRGSFC